MISKGIIEKKIRTQLLTSKLFGILFTQVFFMALCIIAAHFVGISGYIVIVIGLLIGLFFIKPTRDRYTRSQYTIQGYIKAHSVCMDLEKLHDPFLGQVN